MNEPQPQYTQSATELAILEQAKPCPFCGSIKLTTTDWWDDSGEYIAVECSDCKAAAPADAWNRRPAATPMETIEVHDPDAESKLQRIKENVPMKAVMVTTKHRGVFAGLVPDDQDMTARTMALKDARCAIRFATSRGVAELAEVGPNDDSRIGSKADIEALHDITAVWTITDQAWKKWSAR